MSGCNAMSGSLIGAIVNQSVRQGQENVQMAAAVAGQKRAMEISQMAITLIQETLVNLSTNGGMNVLA